jgi:SseB protein N-terminal domain
LNEDQAKFTDSAGVAWQGRTFSNNQFQSDKGEADPVLLQALLDFQAGISDQERVVSAFASARLLVPLVANLGDSGEGAKGLKTDKSAELSIVTVSAPDGQKALPIFTSVGAMAKWNDKARPVPNFGKTIATAALNEGNTRIVLDPTCETEFVIRRPAIDALAKGSAWVSPVKNPKVLEIVTEITKTESNVLKFELGSADPKSLLLGQELLLSLYLSPETSQAEVDAIESRLFTQLSANRGFVELVDSVAVQYL